MTRLRRRLRSSPASICDLKVIFSPIASPLLLLILPFFVVLSVVVCYVFNLTTTKWRFISLPDALKILRAATALALALLVLDHILWRQTPMTLSFSARLRLSFTGFSRYFFEGWAMAG